MAILGWAGKGTYINPNLKTNPNLKIGTITTTKANTANKMANPWAGKSIQEIRQMEYARSPQMKPLEPTELPQTNNATEAERARALAYLKEYVGQMRAAGFNDYSIAQKLMETKVIQIPSNLPENFGRMGTWAAGMANERRMAAMERGNTQEALKNWVPSPNEYLEYMPGYIPNRLPTYEELMGLTSSTGKFSQIRTENLRKALQNYVANYKGPTVSPSQYAYEAGIVGLPVDIGQQYYQEYTALKQKEAEEAQKQQEYEDLVLQYPEIEIQYGDTPQEIAQKIRQYNELQSQQKQVQEVRDYSVKVADDLINDWQSAKSNGENLLGVVNENGNEIDVFEKILKDIRSGKTIDEVFDFVVANNIPISRYELAGLYILNGK